VAVVILADMQAVILAVTAAADITAEAASS